MPITEDISQSTNTAPSAAIGTVEAAHIQGECRDREPTPATTQSGDDTEGASVPDSGQAKETEPSKKVSPGIDRPEVPIAIRLRQLIEDMLDAGTATLCRSTLGTTSFRVGKLPGLAAVDAPVLHQSSQAWMAALSWERFREMPKAGDVNRVAFALLGREPSIEETEPRDDDLLEELRQDPVVGAIIALLDHPSTEPTTWVGTMGNLFEQLLTKSPLQLTSTRAFPGSASILSRHLRCPKTIALLAAFGVKIDIRRSNGSKVCLSSSPDGKTKCRERVLSVDDSVIAEQTRKTDGKDGTNQQKPQLDQLEQMVNSSGVRIPNSHKGGSDE